MQKGMPSRTALKVAASRAVHQLLDQPLVLVDPVAVPILGPHAHPKLQANHWRYRGYASTAARAFVVARSRFAEDHLAQAYAAGVRQYIVLGAGLDTFAYRNPFADLRVFEVDHPSTQAWKRERLAAAKLSANGNASYAGVDFEKDDLPAALQNAGCALDSPAFVSWLGVTMYLTRDAFRQTLRFLGSFPSGSGVTFDYGLPRETLQLLQRFAHDAVARRVRNAGEPFTLLMSQADVDSELKAVGFSQTEDLGQTDINERYYSNRTDRLKVRGGLARMVCAWK